MTMLDNLVSIIFLLLTGIVAVYVGIFLLKEYVASKNKYHLFWGISYIVLFVSGVLIILFDFDILKTELVPVVAALIPIGMAVGLLFAVFEDNPLYGWVFLLYELIMMVITAWVRLAGDTSTSGLIMAMHIPSGILIILLPIVSKEANAYFMSIGGVLISFGGALLAFVAIGSPILTEGQIFLVLPPLLLIVGAFFTLGIVFPEKWRINVPFISDMLVK